MSTRSPNPASVRFDWAGLGLVARGVRGLMRDGCEERDIPAVGKAAADAGLSCVFSDFRADADNRPDGELTRRVAYVARRKKDALEAARLEKITWDDGDATVRDAHAKLGQLLGYPDCCVAAFLERSCLAPFDFIAAIAAASRRLDERLDPFAPQLVFHLPCRFDCQASLALADRVRTAGGREPCPASYALFPSTRWLRTFPDNGLGSYDARPGADAHFSRAAALLKSGYRLTAKGGGVTAGKPGAADVRLEALALEFTAA